MANIGKKIIFLIIAFVFVLTLLSCNKQEELRLRIIANSNSVCDQEEKLLVKEGIKSIYQKYKKIDLNTIQTYLKDYLSNDIYSKIKIEKKEELFPSKTFKGEIIPSGIYESIVITIGSGKGNNFWTMLYPDFFNISFEDDNEIEYHSYIYDSIVK